jgi:hypothetical protein
VELLKLLGLKLLKLLDVLLELEQLLLIEVEQLMGGRLKEVKAKAGRRCLEPSAAPFLRSAAAFLRHSLMM